MIKYLVMDVDGTLTDGKIYMGPSGEAMKAFDVKDGYGVHYIAPQNGITPIIITGRTSQIVLNRSRELGITEVHQGISDKTAKLREVCDDLSSVAYIGDDINDLFAMTAVKNYGGVVGCPADAVREVLHIANFIAPHKGGDGAVRDFIEWIVDRNNVEEGMKAEPLYRDEFSDEELEKLRRVSPLEYQFLDSSPTTYRLTFDPRCVADREERLGRLDVDEQELFHDLEVRLSVLVHTSPPDEEEIEKIVKKLSEMLGLTTP